VPACGGWEICVEYASGRLLRNVGICLPNYTASYPRRLSLKKERGKTGNTEESKAGNVR